MAGVNIWRSVSEVMDILRLFNKFPRQIAHESRRSVESMEDMLGKINELNGKVRIFVSVYNFTNNPAIDSRNLDVDKLFFDLDHPDTSLQDCKKIHSWLMESSIKHIMFFSGAGFHIYIMTTGYLDLKNKRDTVYNAQKFIANALDMVIGLAKKSNIDSKTVGRVDQMATFPCTWNTKRRRYCICITDEDLEKGYDYIKERAKSQNQFFKWYGRSLFNIKKFDTSRPTDFPTLGISQNIKLKIDKDEFLKTLPPCVSYWLTMEHIGYQRRGYLICYLRDTGNLLGDTIQILEKYMTRSEFIHCTTRRIAQGHGTGEEQPQYLYRGFVRGRFTFPSCDTIKELGDCPIDGCKRCEKWKIYK